MDCVWAVNNTQLVMVNCVWAVNNTHESEDLPSQEVRTLLSSYVSFVSSCNYIDVFTLHRALCALVAAQDLIQSKVVVVEGVVSKLEWLLLQPLLTASHRVYVALRDGNSPLKSDSCDVTDMDCWQLRRVDTDGVATDKLLCACFCSSSNAVITSSEVATTSSAVPTTLTEVTTTSSAVVTTSSAVATSAITTTPAKAKVAGLLRGSPITPTHKNGLCSSVVSSACSPCHTPRRQGPGMESLLYVRQVMVCQLRLLLNTRDEMALALNCSLPGTAMSPAAFADIKQEARRINMPMFQTIMSVVQKRRLGGSGYQLASNSSILAHVAPLTDFVDHINALSTVVEDVTCVRTAARQILMSIKRYVAKQCTGVQAQKCPVKISTIEVVHKGLQSRLDRCLRRFESYQDVASSFGGSSIYGKIGSNTNKATRLKLPYPVLSLLQSLCDRCMSECSFNDDSVASFVSLCEGDGGEMVMSQRGGSPIAFTPVRVPSVLTLFHTPPPGEDLHGEEVIAEPSLRVRLMKGRRSTPVRSQRHLSCMAWAPDNLSPVQVDASPVFTSPLPPPRPTSQEVLAAIAELPDRNMEVSNAGSPKNLLNEKRKAGRRQREVLPGPKRSLLKDISNLEANVVNTKEASASINKKLISQNESDRTVSHPKRSSKRSLLSDIDNLAPHIEGCKKSKTEPTRKRAGKKAIDKQLPAGQKSIASFFITKSK
ncbi:hypothetical protein FHG87_008766 [Trinorchestia longiramus]|nr:hypothetical protein FHG87_008766 [Trinorchestia longiramus]